MANQPQQSYWSFPANDLHVALGSSANGLSSEKAQQQLNDVGYNRLVTKTKISPFRIFLGQFKSPIVLILLFATLVSIFVQEWVDAIRGGPPAMSNFNYAGPLTEFINLGVVAIRAQSKIEWDTKNFRITNNDRANQYLHRQYRQGWTL